MKIGIDKIGFYAPHLYVDMNNLAKARDVEPAKFTIGIGQEKMAIAPLTQDAVTLAANAAMEILDDADRAAVDFVIFGTETGVDHSKAAGVYVHHLLNLQPHTRTVEVKQACFGATAGIQMAKGHIALNPDSKVLVLASDIARYGLRTGGEATQGAGAVAMIISKDPKILALEEPSSYLTEDVMDFWRPVYSEYAQVDGKLSNEMYLSFFEKIWNAYKQKTGLGIGDFAAICYHLPYTKMGLKALRTIYDQGTETDKDRLLENLEYSKIYNKHVGNIYTGSLYLSFLSLLEHQSNLNAGDRIGLFSYGSGAVGEFFTGLLQPNYQVHLNTKQHQDLLASRKEVSVEEYEQIFEAKLPKDGTDFELDVDADPAKIKLSGVGGHIRHYMNSSQVKV
ncbi:MULTISPECIES: hydroxymethylglutaryl-CoA synthase [unclassified Virgibacillus]|uniref:hydroxymethylglutaryl-CoA synthase n=1 Tax=unclassified Virgibacillus TaxID=2620237 RepID=UPI00090BACD2|nr:MULTISPECIES: hydroxymethylglutaryl-CoA synthase [unclassified Virgibacillus]API93628.1 hydroxymethylglutaryl-CoA synthase [Virgibacillus sp. 6R]MBS7429979.1 hydroxymethylglutaryl-CoA synthase [Virgibacillus sp. 19R1-5]